MKIDKIIDDFCVKEPLLDKNKQMAKQAIRLIVDRIYKGAFIFTCGNGGSASDSMHIVGELRKKFLVERQLSSSDLEQLQSLGNDLEFFEKIWRKVFQPFHFVQRLHFLPRGSMTKIKILFLLNKYLYLDARGIYFSH